MQQRDPAALLSIINNCIKQVTTNMGVTDIYDLATEVLGIDHLTTQQAAVPQDGTYEFITYEGMSVIDFDLEANKEYLHGLLY